MNDLERVLGWASADERFLDRASAGLDEDRAEMLKAIVETRGDVVALSRRLAPEVLERLRAHAPKRTATALDLLGTPLARAWSTPEGASVEQIAQRFLERYGARLEDLTGTVGKGAAAAKTAANTMQTISASKELLAAAASLEQQVKEVTAAAEACTHPEDAVPDRSDQGRVVAREGLETVDAARKLTSTARQLRARCDAVARGLSAWAEAPPAERASTAETMALHLRAAATVVADMREEIAELSV